MARKPGQNKNNHIAPKAKEVVLSESTIPKNKEVSNESLEKVMVEKTTEVLEKINESVDSVNVGYEPMARNKDTDSIALDEDIACKSVTFGGLVWISPKTNSHYRWNGIGDTEFIPFSELITLNNTKRDFLFKPYFVVQDERVVKYFRLLETYEKVAQIHDLERVFEGSIEGISKVIDVAISVNMRGLMISKVRQMRKDGILTNIDIIKLLEDKLKFDLSDDNASEIR